MIGFGNGLGSGIVMTLGADFAPSTGRAEFLGVWRLIGDVGTAGGPLLVAVVEIGGSLAAASVAVGAIGLAGAVVLFGWLPETLRPEGAPPGARSRTTRRPGRPPERPAPPPGP